MTRRRVLVVDDDVAERRHRAQLLRADARCGEVTDLSFEEAFEFAYAAGDILLLDVHDRRPLRQRAPLIERHLGGLDWPFTGVPLAEQTKKCYGDSVSVIVITNLERNPILMRAVRDARADFVFPKDVLADDDVLRRAVLDPDSLARLPEPSDDDIWEEVAFQVCWQFGLLGPARRPEGRRGNTAAPATHAEQLQNGIRRALTVGADPARRRAGHRDVDLSQVVAVLQAMDRDVVNTLVHDTRLPDGLVLPQVPRKSLRPSNLRALVCAMGVWRAKGIRQRDGSVRYEPDRDVIAQTLRTYLGHQADLMNTRRRDHEDPFRAG